MLKSSSLTKDDKKPLYDVAGSLKQVDVGDDIVWGTNAEDQVYVRIGISPSM
jgi:hypothetical protein